MSDKKILVAYCSFSGNTRILAEKIQQITNGDLFEIKTVKNYPKNYNDILNMAKSEKALGLEPPLADSVDVSGYDVIILGSPVWWYTYATPIRTFLSENDFSGKVIMPFCTHGGGGEAQTFTDIKDLCPDADVKEGFAAFENSAKESDIEAWVKSFI